MQRITALLLVALIFISLWGVAEFRPETREYDFGEIFEKDGKVSYDFTFSNTGDEPLLLIDVHAG